MSIDFNGQLPTTSLTFNMESIAEASGIIKPRIACISDSPKLTTGFANVAREIYNGFYKAGFEIHVFGLMDEEPDSNRELPYSFWHCDAAIDQLLPRFLIQIQPDIVFILADPGSALSHITLLSILEDRGKIKKPKIILYTPLEGYPTPTFNAEMFTHILENKGRVVLYSPGMIELFEHQYKIPDKLDFAYHGSDHANFEKYSREKRNHLRSLCGFDKYFVIGSFGVNKRTKGFDTIIYTAQALREMNQAENIKFYLHTSKDRPTLQGYNLEDLAQIYGVRDMFLFKPEKDKSDGGNIRGIARSSTDDCFQYKIFERTSKEKKKIFSQFSFIDRLNVLDMYFDASQVEGWGLPAFEAMRCGVPTISIDDNTIRSEVYGPSAVLIKPEPFRFWSTWQTGTRLPVVDPKKCAEMIVRLKNDPRKLEIMSRLGVENTKRYSWSDTQRKFNNIVREVLNV